MPSEMGSSPPLLLGGSPCTVGPQGWQGNPARESASVMLSYSKPSIHPCHGSHTQVPFYRMPPPTGLSVPPRFPLARAAGGRPARSLRTHLRLHKVDPLGPELTHAVEDVYHPFVLGHVEHGIDGDEAASPSGSSTRRKNNGLCGVALGRPLAVSSVPDNPAERRYTAEHRQNSPHLNTA